MSTQPFIDTIARSWAASRLSRRAAIGSGLALAAASVVPSSGQTQEATPEAPVDEPGFGQAFLFVQTFTGGTFTAHPQAGMPVAEGTPEARAHGDYLLSLGGHPGQTVYFSDRPARIFGDVPTDQFVEGLGFGAGNPPNAALVTQNAAGQTVVAVLELMNPVVDIRAGTVVYEASLLDDYLDDGLGHLIQQNEADAIPAEFGSASIYIDDCDKKNVTCLGPGSQCDRPTIGSGQIGGCWSWFAFTCNYCTNPDTWCNEHFPACNNSCSGFEQYHCVNSQITD